MGVRWSLNKSRSTSAVRAIAVLHGIIFEKDIQIEQLNGKLFLYDEEVMRCNLELSRKMTELSKCNINMSKLKAWGTIGKVGVIIICVSTAVGLTVLIVQTVSL
jgi:hypothetical protein